MFLDAKPSGFCLARTVHIRVIRCLNGQKDFRCGSWEARYLLGAPPGHEGTPNLLVASKVKRATRTVKSPEFEPDPGWGRDGSPGDFLADAMGLAGF